MDREEFLIWRQHQRAKTREMTKAMREHARADKLIKEEKLEHQPTHHVTHEGTFWYVWWCPRCPRNDQ